MSKHGWTYKKLGECLSYIKNGANIKQTKSATGFPITRIESISGGVFNRDRLGYADIFSTEKLSQYVMDDGDILLSHINSKAYIGRSVLYRKKGDEIIIHGMNLLRLKVIPSIIIPSFINTYFKSDEFKFNVAKIRKDAVNQSSMAITDIKKIPIPVPSLSEQGRIVAELDLLSGIIEKKKEQLKAYDQLAQSIFYTMFGDPINNEKGWDVKKLGDIGMIKAGYTPSVKELKEHGDYPYFKVGDMNAEGNEKYLKYSKSFLDSKFKSFPKGSIVFPKNGAAVATNKKRLLNQDSVVDLNTAILIIDESINLEFMYNWICQIDFRKIIRRGTVPTLDTKELLRMNFPIPPLSLQQEFAERVEAIERQKALVRQSIDETQTLFDSRMDFWFD